MAYQWNWYIFLQPASAKDSYLDWLLSGMLTTLQMGCLAWVIAFCLGSLLGVMRTIPNRAVSFLAELYVEIFRNIPLIVQLFIWYYLVPKLMPQEFRTWLFALPPASTSFYTATIGLGLFTAARVCEQVRAGIDVISSGLKNASLSLGLSPRQSYQYVLLPITYRTILPPMTSEMLSIFKNSSIASTIGVIDLFTRARQLNEYTAHGYESFIAVILCYLIINTGVMLLMSQVERTLRLPGTEGRV